MNEFLNILLGEKLSSVTFVMDYLQLDFDGNRFTFNVRPMVISNEKKYKFGEPFYCDNLCSLITQIVEQVTTKENKSLTILFQNGTKLILSLDPNNPELVTPEIAIFTDTHDKYYVFD